MSYILDVMNGVIEPHSDRISLERYIQESSYITRYLSRVIEDRALVVYHVLFNLSWFETGSGVIVVPWARIGSFIRSQQGNFIDDTTVKRRLPDLIEHKCIAVSRVRNNANEFSVHLPSDISSCRKLIELEGKEALLESARPDERDYNSDPQRRVMILARDGYACVYCTTALSEDNFVLDHLIPVAKGGTNREQNLVAHLTQRVERD